MSLTSVGPGATSSLLTGYVGRLRSATLDAPLELPPDEMVAPDGVPAAAWSDVLEGAEQLGLRGLLAGREEARRLLEDDGVTYVAPGARGPESQAWELDVLPLVVEERTWATLAAGLEQRARLFEALLADFYGSRDTIERGLLPARLVLGHEGYVHALAGVRPIGGRHLVIAATDLARDRDGAWYAIGDRTQAPSGLGYALENRRVISRVVPELYRRSPMRRLAPYVQTMRSAILAAAPQGVDAPSAVLLSPGPDSETAFDQAFVATLLGLPLVEGRDLTVRDGRVWLRALGRLEPVDVILRRVDGSWCDPLELRPESRLGVPGLLEAVRRGTVGMVNAVGAQVMENPALLPFLPRLAQEVLGEELLLPSVETWWCGDPDSRAYVHGNLERLVLRPWSRGRGRSLFGATLSRAERERLLHRIDAEPESWVGQDPLTLSTSPVVSDEGLEPRATVLRSFAVAREQGFAVLSGGLARVSRSAGERRVVSGAGSLAKDVWVLGREERAPGWLTEVSPPTSRTRGGVPPRVAEDFFWFGRYAERAEATVRLLRATMERANDPQRQGDQAAAEALRATLEAVTSVTSTWPGFLGPGAHLAFAEPTRELVRLLVDADRPGTVAHAAQRLSAAAHSVRDQLSTDTWLALGRVDRVIERVSASPDPDAVFTPSLGQVLEGLLALGGVTAETMVRDDGWRLMDAGRRVERALQLVGLLRATVVDVRRPEVDSLVVETVLVAAESIITYRRRYRDRARVATVLDLLVLDAGNPRALLHQLERLDEDLRALPGGEGSSGPERRLATLATRVRRLDSGHLVTVDGHARPQLDKLLDELDTALRDLSDAIASTHFRSLAPPQPL